MMNKLGLLIFIPNISREVIKHSKHSKVELVPANEIVQWFINCLVRGNVITPVKVGQGRMVFCLECPESMISLVWRIDNLGKQPGWQYIILSDTLIDKVSK